MLSGRADPSTFFREGTVTPFPFKSGDCPHYRLSGRVGAPGAFTSAPRRAASRSGGPRRGAASRAGIHFIVLDGLEGPRHNQIVVPRQAFDTPGKLRYVVVDRSAGDARNASLVEVPWPADRTFEDAFPPPAAK